jgi:hypothetical protein
MNDGGVRRCLCIRISKEISDAPYKNVKSMKHAVQ